MYRHNDYLGSPIDLPVSKVVCVGRNYRDHIQEMDALATKPVTDDDTQPLLFLKPVNALCALEQPVTVPADRGECHNELEIAVLLKQRLCKADTEEVQSAIWGVGIGLDLTLRDIQHQLKAKGHPWERAKAFDFSCPVSGFVPLSMAGDLQELVFALHINGDLRQQGNSSAMIHDILSLISHMSGVFTLDAGDIIMTGTPKGVGPLQDGDSIRASLANFIKIETTVTAI